MCRANFRVLTLIVGISALAAFNALYVPLHLERVIHTHPRSIALLDAARADGWLKDSNGSSSGQTPAMPVEAYSVAASVNIMPWFVLSCCMHCTAYG